MAHHKSAIKRIEIAARNRMRNRHYISMMRTILKKVRSVNNKAEGEQLLQKTSSTLDKLVKKGIIHRNKAANQKSKLSAVIKKLS